MEKSTEQRWIELQFYFICADLLSLRNNLIDVMDMIDNLALFGDYSPEYIKPIAQEVLASVRIRPSKEEFCILCHIFKKPVAQIKQRTQIHNKTLYKIIEDHKENPRLFYPRLKPEQLQLITQFINTFNKFRKVGL